MAAVGFALLSVGAMLIYAGMTGDSLPGAVREVVQGKSKSKSGGSGFGGANGGGGSWGAGADTEAKRDAAQTRRPAQP